jgi:hypothetical protein
MDLPIAALFNTTGLNHLIAKCKEYLALAPDANTLSKTKIFSEILTCKDLSIKAAMSDGTLWAVDEDV